VGNEENAMTKRARDIMLPSVAFILLAPLLAVVAVLISLGSLGPFYYRGSE